MKNEVTREQVIKDLEFMKCVVPTPYHRSLDIAKLAMQKPDGDWLTEDDIKVYESGIIHGKAIAYHEMGLSQDEIMERIGKV